MSYLSIRDKTYKDELTEEIVEKLLANPYTTHSRMLELVGKNKTILEVGCATGYMTKKFKENNCSIIGIEINPDYYAIAEKRIREAYMQPPLFVEVEKRENPVQGELFGGVE